LRKRRILKAWEHIGNHINAPTDHAGGTNGNTGRRVISFGVTTTYICSRKNGNIHANGYSRGRVGCVKSVIEERRNTSTISAIRMSSTNGLTNFRPSAFGAMMRFTPENYRIRRDMEGAKKQKGEGRQPSPRRQIHAVLTMRTRPIYKGTPPLSSNYFEISLDF